MELVPSLDHLLCLVLCCLMDSDSHLLLLVIGMLLFLRWKCYLQVRRRLQSGMGDRVAESLLTTTTSLASEYFTQEEMTQFKKPKKKKKLRKKDKLDIDVLEAEAVAEGLGTGDLGSRESTSRRADRQEEMKAAADVRRERYENALLKAADASKVLKEESMARTMEVDDTEDGLVVGTEEDETLTKSLERARQAALKKQAESTIGLQGIVARLAGMVCI